MTTLLGRSCPLIAGVVSTPEALAALDVESAAACDLIELRFDQLAMPLAAFRAECARVRTLVPILLTHRWSAEGGGADDDQARWAVYEALVQDVDAFDIELASSLAARVSALAVANGVTLILSFHDFQGLPEICELRKKIARMRELGAVPKLAVTVETDEQVRELEALLRDCGSEPTCVIGMGTAGQQTRFGFPRLGSCLTYGYIDRPSAPGQPSCCELRNALKPG